MFVYCCAVWLQQAGFGTNATGTGACLLCPLGSFWSAPNSNPYGRYGSNSPDSQDRYDSPDPQGRYSDRYDSPDEEDENWFLAARIQQTTPANILTTPAGVRPCINCSDILPPGSSATTLELGADAASACVCSPGVCAGAGSSVKPGQQCSAVTEACSHRLPLHFQ